MTSQVRSHSGSRTYRALPMYVQSVTRSTSIDCVRHVLPVQPVRVPGPTGPAAPLCWRTAPAARVVSVSPRQAQPVLRLGEAAQVCPQVPLMRASAPLASLWRSSPRIAPAAKVVSPRQPVVRLRAGGSVRVSPGPQGGAPHVQRMTSAGGVVLQAKGSQGDALSRSIQYYDLLQPTVLPVHMRCSEPGVAVSVEHLEREHTQEKREVALATLGDASTGSPQSSNAGSSPWLSLMSPAPSRVIGRRSESPGSRPEDAHRALASSVWPLAQQLDEVEEASSEEGRVDLKRLVQDQDARMAAMEARLCGGMSELRSMVSRLQDEVRAQGQAALITGGIVPPTVGGRVGEMVAWSPAPSSRTTSVVMGMSPSYEQLCRMSASP